jgi:hypothetical protein
LTKTVQDTRISISKKKVDDSYLKTVRSLENVSGKFEALKEGENKLKDMISKLLTRKLEENSNNPSIKSVIGSKKLLFNNFLTIIFLEKKIFEDIERSWDNLCKVEKLNNYIKKKQLEEELHKSFQELNRSALLNTSTDFIGEFDKTLENFYRSKDYSDDLLKILEITSDLQQRINKYCQEIEKVGEIPNLGGNINNRNVTQPPIISNIIEQNDRTIQSNLTVNPTPTPTPTPIPITYPSLTITPAEYNYFITYKARSQEILFIDPNVDKDKAQVVKLHDSCFLDGRMANFPPEYSKYINIKDAILITGGVSNGSPINTCFFLKIDKSNNQYTCIVTSYSPMLEKRERHNMIYLDDTHEVFVCGGFYLKTAERTKLTENQTWTAVAQMKDSRANATLLYYNQRYVYCFGGFSVSDRLNSGSSGVYLNSCEFIDVKNPNASWTEVNLESLFNINMRFCAMGVIQLSNSKFLLVGGYDGTRYLNDIHEVTFDGHISKAHKVGLDSNLGRGVIFPSSSKFAQWGNMFINFDFSNKVVQYDGTIKKFMIK